MWFLFAVLAAICYSLLWIFARMSRGIPSTVVTAAEYITGPFLLLAVIRTVDYPWHELWWWGYLAFPFLFVPFFVWASTYAVHRAEVTYLKPLFGLSSIMTLLISSLFFGEKVGIEGIAGILLIVFGLFALYQGRLGEWKKISPWIMLAAALFYGANAAVIAAVLHRFPHVLGIAAMIFMGSFVMNLPMAIRDLPHMRWSRYYVLVLLGMIVANIGQDIFTLVGFTYGPSSYVIAVKRMSVLLTAVIGYVFLHERDQSLPRLMASSGMVVAGVLLLTLS